MEQIESVAQEVPYMVAAGNHESHHNFSHYTNRFEMPNKRDSANLFYSFDLGLVHFVAYNTEAYFNMTDNGAASGDGNDCVKAQYHWLAADLAKANANRAAVPWVVIFGHRPMYCNVAAINTTTHAQACDGEQEQSRNGGQRIPTATSGGAVGQTNYAVEDLLYKHGVDLAFYGHVHGARILLAFLDCR